MTPVEDTTPMHTQTAPTHTHITPTRTTSTTRTAYIRRSSLPGSGDELAADIDRAIERLAGGRVLASVALAPITREGMSPEGGGTAGVLVTVVFGEPA